MEKNIDEMSKEISKMVNEVKNNLAREINKSIVFVYWSIGKTIVMHECSFGGRLGYGDEILDKLSKELTKLLGKGYSYTNLTYMRWFYNEYRSFDMIYALGGLSNNIFASTYTYYIPDKEILMKEVENILNDNAIENLA